MVLCSFKPPATTTTADKHLWKNTAQYSAEPKINSLLFRYKYNTLFWLHSTVWGTKFKKIILFSGYSLITRNLLLNQ